MPEGAEVKIIGEGLARIAGSRSIVSITPISGRYTKKPIEGLSEFSLPSRVVGVGTKGKLIFWMFDNDVYLLNTLGMTGSWSSQKTKHSRIVVEFNDQKLVYFNDPRNFGTIKIIKGKSSFIQKLDSLGPDMLSEDVSDELFSFCIRDGGSRKGYTVCEALLDQSLVCGVGNYVKAEALYRAGLSPHRLCESLSDEELSKLNFFSKEVLRQAYRDQGATLRDYRNVDGSAGEASLSFKVYGKKKDPDGNEVIREKTLDGRTTHWCPSVQF